MKYLSYTYTYVCECAKGLSDMRCWHFGTCWPTNRRNYFMIKLTNTKFVALNKEVAIKTKVTLRGHYKQIMSFMHEYIIFRFITTTIVQLYYLA